MVIDVDFYELPDGTEPVKVFLDSLEIKLRAKMYREIDLLVNNGPELREPHSKHVEDGIFELRAKQGNDISRVLYFFVLGKKAILTNGFMKKTKKTPKNEIELAKRYRKDYLNRLPNGR
jgi:phage-related protein